MARGSGDTPGALIGSPGAEDLPGWGHTDLRVICLIFRFYFPCVIPCLSPFSHWVFLGDRRLCVGGISLAFRVLAR